LAFVPFSSRNFGARKETIAPISSFSFRFAVKNKYMSQFYALPLVAKKQETADAVSLSFLVPDDLKNTFAYKAGQYLTLEVEVNGEKVRRAYSLCSCPLTDDQLTVAVKKVEGGKVSTFLNGPLQLGQTIIVMPPEGRFTPNIDASNKVHYFLFAGGSGITPMKSIIRTVLKAEPQSIITLIYANRNKQSVMPWIKRISSGPAESRVS
jgi:ring-1,2-phenylacetyl-CoA epoxidase subunit PaaE